MSTPKQILDRVRLNDNQSLVDLMFKVQLGEISCRRAASEILRRYKNEYKDKQPGPQKPV